MFKEPPHRYLIAELSEGQSADASMVLLAYRANVGDFGRAVFGEWLDVMEFDLLIINYRVIFDEAVKHLASPLLC